VPLFDTHAHLVSDQLKGLTEEILASAKDAGLAGITSIGTDLASSRACVALAEKHDQIYAAVGVHPNECHQASESDWDEICQLAQHPRVVAVGETGLDRYWDTVPIELQREWFERHIDLSFEIEKPLVIHMRDCDQDIVDMLNQHQREGRIIGILHSFAAQWATAQRALELGMYISFAGMVTFKKSAELREIAKKIPDDRILVETDAPYLSPHPHRNVRPNQPAMVQHTAACLAAERGVAVEEFGELVTENAKRAFKI